MRRLAALLAALGLLAGCGGGDDVDGGPSTAPAQGREGERRADEGDPVVHLRALQRIADRSDGTRAAGTAGDRATVDYIERSLRASGWRTERQRVEFPYFELRSPPRLAGLRAPREVRAAEYSGAGRVRARVQRAARGCSVSDFDGVRAGGIALVDRGTCFFRVKARNAARAGAGAVVISDVYGRTPVSATLLRPGIEIPVLVVTGRGARAIENRTVSLRVDAISERRSSSNVIAESRPAADGRWLMAGGHHDSVSAGPGLNDNGSGVAALLAIANRLRGRAGLRLGFWAAEELALYGSRHYVRGLGPGGRRDLRAYLNFDMVGSPNARVAVYDRDDEVERALRRAIRGPEREVGLNEASDHAPFERAGIAVGGIFTGASERGRRPGPADRCYHRACDTLRNVDLPLTRRMTDAAERALTALSRP